MARKIALVLSGGGAKGAFQAAVEKYAREKRGYEWTAVAGVSVGALNAVMIAMGKQERLWEIWNTITNDKVYRGRGNWWGIAKAVIFKKLSIYSNEPLWEMIERDVQSEDISLTLRIGIVSLADGRYYPVDQSDPEFKKKVLASTSIPVVFPPVDEDLVDGGVRNISPIADVLKSEPDEVIIVNCSDPGYIAAAGRPESVVDVARRTIDILTNEVFKNDLNEILKINRLVRQANENGFELFNDEGKPYSYFDVKIIQPDEPLGETLDFSREAIENRISHGFKKAREILG